MFGKYWYYLISIPKSLYFCLHYFPVLTALHLPVLVSYRTRLNCLRGKVELPQDKLRTGLVKIGFGYTGIFDTHIHSALWENAGVVCFRGGAFVGYGCAMSVGKDARLEIGDNFSMTACSQIMCCRAISIADDVLISWQCMLMDTDWHTIKSDGQVVNQDMPLQLGRNVWVGCRSTILKGVTLADGCIVAAGSIVTRSVVEKNVCIGGNPVRIIKKNVRWSPEHPIL